MTQRLAWTVLLLCALAACSDKQQPQTGSQTHFLQTCDESCPAPYECICGACTLSCKNDAPCRDEVHSAHCTVAVSTADALQCNTDSLVCDVACQRQSDCNSLGAGYTCEGSRCRAAPRGSSTSTGSGASGETPPPEICDGSDGIRFGIWNTFGSFTSTGDMFMNPLAYSFAFIDGHCRFVASATALAGVASGTLDDAEAQQLAIEIHLASFAAFQGQSRFSCMDGGTTVVSDGPHPFDCMCANCGKDAPAGMTEAMDASQTWIMRLAAEGTPWTGPVRAVATDFLGTLHIEAPQPWPLASTIDDIFVPSADVSVDSGVVFDSASDAAALRTMRKQQSMTLGPSTDISVTNGQKNYSLFVRDELPRATTAPFMAFETASWKVIEDAANAAAEKELAARDAGSR